MTDTPWHADTEALRDYAVGRTSLPLASSLEAHLLHCPSCRTALRAEADQTQLARVWERVVDDVLSGPTPRAERLALRLGMAERDALVAASAPRVRGAWLLAVLLCVLLGVVAVSTGDSWATFIFLTVAPLLPVGAVGLAYGQDADPIWETTLATPSDPVRLLVVRSVAVLAVAVPVLLIAAILLPGPSWAAAAWLLPALAGTALTLALSTWFTVSRAALGVTAAWVATTVLTAGPGFHNALLVLNSRVLPLYLVVAVVGSAVFWLRLDRLSLPGRI
jgi:hypothetical protein